MLRCTIFAKLNKEQKMVKIWALLAAYCFLACTLGQVQGKLHGITHSPLSTNRNNICIDQARLLANMELVSQTAENFRVYAIGNCKKNTVAVLEFARRKKMGVYLGLWISHNMQLNELELEVLETVVFQYQDVIKAVVVGNEPVFVLKVRGRSLEHTN